MYTMLDNKNTFIFGEQLDAVTRGHSSSVGYLQKQDTTLDETDPVLCCTS